MPLFTVSKNSFLQYFPKNIHHLLNYPKGFKDILNLNYLVYPTPDFFENFLEIYSIISK
jgi:hypothetical protein